jgi:phytoene synthase
MHLFPRRQAQALAAVYSVARIADDFADEDQFRTVRTLAVSRWQDWFERACEARTRHPAMVALADSMTRFQIDPEHFRDYFASCIQESSPLRFDTWGQVEEFARMSFGSIGKVVMCILGLNRTDLQYWAERLSVALFLTCRLRDLSVDIPRSRVFLPREHLEEFGLRADDISDPECVDSLSSAIKSAVERTRWIYREAYPLVLEAGGYSTAMLAGVWLGGRSLLRLVDRSADGLLRSRPGLSIFTFARTMMGAGLERLPGVLT